MEKFNGFMYWLTSMLLLLFLFILFGLFSLLPMLFALAIWNNEHHKLPQSYFMRDYIHPFYLINRMLTYSKNRNILLLLSLPMILSPITILLFPFVLTWFSAFSNQAVLLRNKTKEQNPLVFLANKYPETFMQMQKDFPNEITQLDNLFANEIPQSLIQFRSKNQQSDVGIWENGIEKINQETKKYLFQIWHNHHQEQSPIDELKKQMEIFNNESRYLLNSFEQSYYHRKLS